LANVKSVPFGKVDSSSSRDNNPSGLCKYTSEFRSQTQHTRISNRLNNDENQNKNTTTSSLQHFNYKCPKDCS